MFVSEDLIRYILRDDIQFSKAAVELQSTYEHNLYIAQRNYVNFTKHKPTKPGDQWPDFNHKNFEAFFAPPKAPKLKEIFHAGFDLLFPYLQRDLYHRSPGRFLRFDGQYKVAMKTLDDDQSEEETRVLLVMCGEFGHVIGWIFCRAEGSKNYQNLSHII